MTDLVTETELSKRARVLAADAAKALHNRKVAGQEGDYRINDENGVEVWASELSKRYYRETRPRGVMRHR